MRLKGLEKRGKRIALAFLRPLARGRPLAQGDLVDRRLKQILVVRQDERLGNLILITPFLEALQEILPHAHISALVSSRYADVLGGNPDVDEIIPFDKRKFLHNPLRFMIFLRKLRRHAFDLAIDCGPVDNLSLNNALLTYLSGAPVRLGYLRGESSLFLNFLIPPSKEAQEEVDYHLDLLRCSFGDVHRGRLKFFLTPQERKMAAERQREWGLQEKDFVVGMHAGGRGQKRWPMARFAELSQRLIQDYGAKVILFWGPGECQEIGQFESRSFTGLTIAPPLEVRELAGHLECCAVFICGDTGPMHLALAIGTPTVAIFRVPNFGRYGQQGLHNKIVHRPGGNVSVGDVLAAFRELYSTLTEESSHREAVDQSGFSA
jgi:ADP-heptose:LPS heptosyltransferase